MANEIANNAAKAAIDSPSDFDLRLLSFDVSNSPSIPLPFVVELSCSSNFHPHPPFINSPFNDYR